MKKGNAINVGKIKIISFEWYVPHLIGSISQQAILSNQNLSKTPTEFEYLKRSVFSKEVNTQKLWNFQLRTQERINILIWIIVSFQQRARQDSPKFTNDSFYRPPVTSAQCIIGTEKYPDNSRLSNCDDDDYCQG